MARTANPATQLSRQRAALTKDVDAKQKVADRANANLAKAAAALDEFEATLTALIRGVKTRGRPAAAKTRGRPAGRKKAAAKPGRKPGRPATAKTRGRPATAKTRGRPAGRKTAAAKPGRKPGRPPSAAKATKAKTTGAKKKTGARRGRPPGKRSGVTVQQALVSVMSKDAGMSAPQIVEAAKARHKIAVKRTTASTTLSMLKRKGIVVNDASGWKAK